MVNYIPARIVADPITGTDIYVPGWKRLDFKTIILKGLNFPNFMGILKGKTQKKPRQTIPQDSTESLK